MVSAEERLLSLWHALDTTEVGRSKADIKRTVPGYGELQTDDAFERMFSRDKSALRSAGIEVETRLSGGRERYRLVESGQSPVVDLTPAEVGAVRLAAGLWQGGELSAAATEAAQKLVGNNDAIPNELGDIESSFAAPIPFIPIENDLFHPLMRAISNRQRVLFNYRNAVSGKFRKRQVEPWRLAFRDGGWYLLGRDAELASARAFRLSRINGEVKVINPRNAFLPNPNVNVGELLGETGHTVKATLAVKAGRAARLRANGIEVTDGDTRQGTQVVPPGFEVIAYRYNDEREFADELAGLGANVIVLAPTQLKTAVLTRLRAAAQLGL